MLSEPITEACAQRLDKSGHYVWSFQLEIFNCAFSELLRVAKRYQEERRQQHFVINVSTFEGCTKFKRSMKKGIKTLMCGAQLRQLLVEICLSYKRLALKLRLQCFIETLSTFA
jgi:hypothetical protein